MPVNQMVRPKKCVKSGQSPRNHLVNNEQRRTHKRRKINSGKPLSVEHPKPTLSFEPLLEQLEISDAEDSFEGLLEGVLPAYIQDRANILQRSADMGVEVSTYHTSSTVADAHHRVG